MKYITYRITYAEGQVDNVEVYAKSINSGFRKVAALVTRPEKTGRWEVSSIEFWKVA